MAAVSVLGGIWEIVFSWADRAWPSGLYTEPHGTVPAGCLTAGPGVRIDGGAYLGPVLAARPTYAMRTISAPASTDPAYPWRRPG